MSTTEFLLSKAILLIATAIIGGLLLFIVYCKTKSKQTTLVDYFKSHRKFVHISSKKHNDSFRIMTYNILAPLDSYLVWNKYCPQQHLSWNYRLPRIMAQIIAFNPDIICMQEVAVKAFEKNLKCEFNKLHYNAWQVERGKDALNDHSQAIFWKKSAFKCKKKKIFRFAELCKDKKFEKYIGKKDEKNALFQTLKSLNDACMVLHLQHIESSKDLVVCNSHFFWNPMFEDVKLSQCMIMNVSLYALITEEWKLNVEDISIVFGVDANSLPLTSGVYKLMTTGNVDKEHCDHPIRQGQKRNDPMDCVTDVGVFDNENYDGLKWKSVYNVHGKEPMYTNKTKNFEGTLDYLYYCGECEPLSYLEMPFCNDLHKKEFNVDNDKDCAERFEYFPNENYPSDHIALVADMQF